MAEGGNDREASAASPAPATGLLSVFHVFTDERCNAKLLALAVGASLGGGGTGGGAQGADQRRAQYASVLCFSATARGCAPDPSSTHSTAATPAAVTHPQRHYTAPFL